MTTLQSTSDNDDQGERILLVDDNLTNLQVLLHTLSGHGFRLLIAKSGEAALKIAERSQPALVLLDIMMPGIDGFEVCRRLKTSPETRHIAILFLSALNDTKDKVKGLELGAVDFISKPFQAEEVIARVETQLKIHRLEIALSRRNRELEADKERILESMREGIFGVDAKNCVRFANRAANAMTGWQENELVGLPLPRTLLPPADNAKLSPLELAQQGKTSTYDDCNFICKNGRSLPVDFSCAPIVLHGKVEGAVIVFRDISEKKQQQETLNKAIANLREQQEKLSHFSRLSMMGETAAGIAHEVNQPLTAISNYAQVSLRLLGQEPLDLRRLREVLKKISRQALRAAEVIARIRRFVKKPVHYTQSIDVNALLQDILKLAEVDIQRHHALLHLDLAKNLPLVQVDPVQIQQVGLNLIRNAMEAMSEENKKKRGIHIKTELLNEEFIEVSVKDFGSGLSTITQDKLFTPFYTTKPDGVGIGLSICHSIIQAHGGRLWFDSNPEGGSIFKFTLKVV